VRLRNWYADFIGVISFTLPGILPAEEAHMSRITLAATAIVAVLASAPRADASYIVTGTLVADVDPYPVGISPAVGTFSATLDLTATTATLAFTVTFDPVNDLIGGNVTQFSFVDISSSVSLANFGLADFTDYSVGPTSFSTTWNSEGTTDALTATAVTKLLAGQIDAVVGTDEFPAGEVHGLLQASPTNPVPEPSSLVLALVGGAGLGVARFGRRILPRG
jgi:hypothetical protein